MNQDRSVVSSDDATRSITEPVVAEPAVAESAVVETAPPERLDDAATSITPAEPRPEPVAEPAPDRTPRPIIERIGLALIAIVLGSLFGVVAAAAWNGGEPFLAAMGAIGCVMTLWVGGLTLFRG